LPDAMEGPTPVSAIIHAAAMVSAGIYMLLRIFPLIAVSLEGAPWVGLVIAGIGAFTAIMAATIAVAQYDVKRMLAYSTISHVGFLLLGFVGSSPAGYAAAAFYAISYVLTAVVAFGMIAVLARAGFEAENIDDFKGLNKRSPWYAGMMVFVMFSLAGVPPLFGFFAKLLVLKAAIDAGFLWLAIVAIVFAIIGLYYYLRVVKVMYFDAAADAARLPLPADLPLRWVISLNGLALVALGFLWGPLYDWCNLAFGV